MSKPYTTDGTPPTGDIFAGMMPCRIEEAELKESSTGKVMAHLHFLTLDANEEGYRGKHNHAYLVIGTDEDPMAEDPITFTKKSTMGFRQLRDIWSATKYPKTNDLEADVPGLKGLEVLINFTTGMNKDRGEIEVRPRAFFPLGARPTSFREIDAETGKMGPVQMVNGSAPAPVAAASVGQPTAVPGPPR